MNILLTNDDGYFSSGIKLLKEKLSKYGHIVIVAPKNVMSAKSVSITLGRGMEVVEIEKDVFYCDGTPADCVAFGLSSLNTKFDLVVSGCNDGFNISYDTMYSGTIGACLQSLTYKIPAIAFSAEGNLELVEKCFDEVFKYIIDNKLLSQEYLLNVNFPIGEKMLGIKLTHIYYRDESTYYIKNSDGTFLAVRDIKDKQCNDIDSDVHSVYNGYVSITKLKKINF